MSPAIASHCSACQNKFKVHLAFVFPLADDKKHIKCHQILCIGQVFGQWGNRTSTTSVKFIQGNKTNSDVKFSKEEPCHHLICCCGYSDYKYEHLLKTKHTFKDTVELSLLKHINS